MNTCGFKQSGRTSLITENLRTCTKTPASTASCRAALRMANRAAIGPEQPVARNGVASGGVLGTVRVKASHTGANEPPGVCDEQTATRKRGATERCGLWFEFWWMLTKDQDATARVAEGELDRGEALRRKVSVAAARADRVQIERQLEPRAGDGDRLGELHRKTGSVFSRCRAVCSIGADLPLQRSRASARGGGCRRSWPRAGCR